MKQLTIGENEAGQRFDKYLGKLLREAPKSFCYKMLRKKNITLNGKKATGNEMLFAGDQVELFLSDETYEKFCGSSEVKKVTTSLSIVYEDEDILLINKPVGMLSQSAGDGTPSLNEYIIGYLMDSGQIREQDLRTFRPSVCNRLDRNTSGIVAAGKSLRGLQQLSKVFHDRTVHKDYLALVEGKLTKKEKIKGFLLKDEKTNKVQIDSRPFANAVPIETWYTPLGNNANCTLLMVRLITGRTHQIRAHLSSIGHTILGDSKYGSRSRLKHQLLHAYRLEFPEDMGNLSQLSGKVFYADLPDFFKKKLSGEKLDAFLPEEK